MSETTHETSSPARSVAMAWWKKRDSFGDPEQSEVDYYQEGLDLLRAGKYHEAVTSLRLALRERPSDPYILQQIAIAYTRIGMTDEAVRMYRTVLERDPNSVGAHYGLAFLMLREGRREQAASHLREFLARPPEGDRVAKHVEHARRTLAELSGAPREPAGGGEAHG